VLLWCADQFDRVDPAGEGREQCFGFEAGDVLPDALVQSYAEADVAGGIPGQVESVGVVPPARVAVRIPEEHQDLVSLGNADVADAYLGGRRAEEGLHR